jgi:hypothetical protein
VVQEIPGVELFCGSTDFVRAAFFILQRKNALDAGRDVSKSISVLNMKGAGGGTNERIGIRA